MGNQKVFVVASNILSPLGNTTAENFEACAQEKSGVQYREDRTKSDIPFYAALMPAHFWTKTELGLTPFEFLAFQSAQQAISIWGGEPGDSSTGFILSATKGNVGLLESGAITPEKKAAVGLGLSAKKIAQKLGITTQPLVVSQACISGVLAIITAKRLLEAGTFTTVVVTGADLISRFVLSGFQSFHAVSDAPCKPFDVNRNGINLGEAAATLILSTTPKNYPAIEVTGGAISNDANHISGPSRTGAELSMAIKQAMTSAGLASNEIDFISAHGTATIYNDDMESRAFLLAGLSASLVNSLKGYFGHTLGAAGLVESAISIESLHRNTLLPTLGFENPGTVESLNICTQLVQQPLVTCLKTASGFGGCNAAVVYQKMAAADENGELLHNNEIIGS